MSSSHSVTAWIQQLKAGDEAALGPLFRRYWPLLASMARRRLGDLRGGADEDDVAQEAMWSFFRSLKEGRLPRLENRQDLLALLTHIVSCRAFNLIKHEVGVARRGGGRVRGESALQPAKGDARGGLDQVASAEPSPDENALLADCYEHYLTALPERLREIAELHLAGLTNREIAEKLDCAERTVERKLALLKEQWQAMATDYLS